MRLFFIGIILFVNTMSSQNLVYNGDFELSARDSGHSMINRPFEGFYNTPLLPGWIPLFNSDRPIYINKSKYFQYGRPLRYQMPELTAFKNNGFVLGIQDFMWINYNYSPPRLFADTFSGNGYSDWGLIQKLQTKLIKDSWYTVSYRYKTGLDRDYNIYPDTAYVQISPSIDSMVIFYDSFFYRNLLSRFDVLFTTYEMSYISPFNGNTYRILHRYSDSFPSALHDTFFDNSYKWRLIEHTFKADSNYEYLNLARFQKFWEAKFFIDPNRSKQGRSYNVLDFYCMLDDVRLLRKEHYLKVSKDTTVCKKGDTVVLKVLSGIGGYQWRNVKNRNLILSSDTSIIIVANDSISIYEVMSPYDTASIMVYIAKEKYYYDTINHKSCQNKPLKISVPNIKIWHDNSIDTAKTFFLSGSYWYQTKEQCNFKRTQLNLQIENNKYDTIQKTSCDSFTYKNINYKNSGVYTFKYISSFGCDSLQTLELKINPSSYNLAKQFSCTPYLWQDSLYKTSGIYTKRYKTNQLCDSSLVLDLTIGLNDKIKLENGINYTALADSVSYQWFRCNPWRRITNETKKTFTTTTKGSYAVVVSNGTCTDTSDCVALYSSSLQTVITANAVIYPNPFNSNLTIDLTQIHKEINIKIYDMTGRQVLNMQYKNRSTCDLKLETLTKGSYYLQIETENNTQFFNILKD